MLNFKKINEKDVVEFSHNLLDYYSEIDNHFTGRVLESGTETLKRKSGWYQYQDGSHVININVPNIMRLKDASVASLDEEGFYGFLTFIVGHEYRRFLQARHNKDGVEIGGYSDKDILNDELIFFIKMFFDEYYIANKGFFKPEVDADKFALEHGWGYLTYFPELDVNWALGNAADFYARLQHRASSNNSSTIPIGFSSLDEIVAYMERHISLNLRCFSIESTLDSKNPDCLGMQRFYDISREKILDEKLIKEYRQLTNGTMRDLLIANEIIKKINNPEEALETFPEMRKKLVI